MKPNKWTLILRKQTLQARLEAIAKLIGTIASNKKSLGHALIQRMERHRNVLRGPRFHQALRVSQQQGRAIRPCCVVKQGKSVVDRFGHQKATCLTALRTAPNSWVLGTGGDTPSASFSVFSLGKRAFRKIFWGKSHVATRFSSQPLFPRLR